MGDMLFASSAEIRAELTKLDARRARLRKLLAIAEEDEGKVLAKKPESAPEPEPVKEEPAPAGEPMPAERDRPRRPGR